MIGARGGLRLPHLVLLMVLATSLLPTVLPTSAAARVRDTVQMGDPTDDQSPSPGPGATKNSRALGTRTYLGDGGAKVFVPMEQGRTAHYSLLEFLWSLQMRVIIVIR